MRIDKNKQYRTRDGHEVRIYATDGSEPFLIHGAIKINGEWVHQHWLEDGSFMFKVDINDAGKRVSDYDLIEILKPFSQLSQQEQADLMVLAGVPYTVHEHAGIYRIMYAACTVKIVDGQYNFNFTK